MSEDRDIRIDRVREFVETNGEDIWPGGRDNTANVLGEHRKLSEPMSDADAKSAMFARSRRGFIVGSIATLAAVVGWRWMPDETKNALYHRAFASNERLSQFLYSPQRLAPEFAPDRITEARVNGMEGLETEIDLDAWRLNIAGLPGQDDVALTLSDLKKMGRTEMTTELKCIEGWSIIVHWAGVTFSDLVAILQKVEKGKPVEKLPQYVSLITPDEKYFVGWDTPSIMHPQTLLAYEMNGEPLTNEHGAPLRLASPTKYGIKQIKRIGRIEFTNERPPDFWAEAGYDWYSGH
jgi:DMSO/TMAO reductase YedYZ molybdopterin-dependent catalytic subunit